MSRLPSIIGITGKAGSGKDTLAAHFVSKYHCTRRAFADPIKELLNEKFGWEMSQWDDREWKERAAVLSADTVDVFEPKYGYSAPQKPRATWSPRQLAQWLGTEVGRNTFGQDCWVRVMERWARIHLGHEDRLVIPDVRFDNEAIWIRKMGGIIIQLHRPNTIPVAEHVSERGIDPDHIYMYILNDGTIEDLYKAVDHDLSEMFEIPKTP